MSGKMHIMFVTINLLQVKRWREWFKRGCVHVESTSQ